MAEPNSDDSEILDFIPTMVSDTYNQFLVEIRMMSKVKEAVWALDPNSAPDPDG